MLNKAFFAAVVLACLFAGANTLSYTDLKVLTFNMENDFCTC